MKDFPDFVSTRPATSGVQIDPAPRGWRVKTPFSKPFIDALKDRLPVYARSFEPSSKAWLVSDAFGIVLADLLHTHFDWTGQLPEVLSDAAPVHQTFRVEYVGACKPAIGGESVASGFCNGGWSLVFPESVLRAWFESAPAPPQSLYAILNVSQQADAQAIKSAYRQLARQTHPDVCREEGAAEQFQAIKRAYDTLSDATLRRRYDVGLVFTNQLPAASDSFSVSRHYDGYRAPLRCGFVTADAVQTIRGWQIKNIHGWQDIINADGRVMVSSWPRGSQSFVIDWVQPAIF